MLHDHDFTLYICLRMPKDPFELICSSVRPLDGHISSPGPPHAPRMAAVDSTAGSMAPDTWEVFRTGHSDGSVV